MPWPDSFTLLEWSANALTAACVWLAARRLHRGKFVWAPPGSPNVALEHAQLNALVLGLPWQRVGSQGAITVI